MPACLQQVDLLQAGVSELVITTQGARRASLHEIKDNIMKKTEFSLSQTVMRLAELGLDKNEIAYSLCLTKRKFTALMEQKEISDALEKGSEVRARRVEDALYRRAVGFEYEEVRTTSTLSGGKSAPLVREGGQKTKTSASVKSTKKTEVSKSPSSGGSTCGGSKGGVTLKTVPPDVTAIIFWLKNCMPDKWRDPKDIISGKKSFQELIEAYDEEEETE